MFISFWAFKGENAGATMAAATQCRDIYSRLSDGKQGRAFGLSTALRLATMGFILQPKLGIKMLQSGTPFIKILRRTAGSFLTKVCLSS